LFIADPLIYWPDQLLRCFIACVLLTEVFPPFRSFYFFLLPVVLVYLSAMVSQRLGVAGE
jgi:hypothetical protein